MIACHSVERHSCRIHGDNCPDYRDGNIYFPLSTLCEPGEKLSVENVSKLIEYVAYRTKVCC